MQIRSPGSGRPPGGGHGNPLQSSCLENPMHRGAWRAAAPGATRVRLDIAAKQHKAVCYTHLKHLFVTHDTCYAYHKICTEIEILKVCRKK